MAQMSVKWLRVVARAWLDAIFPTFFPQFEIAVFNSPQCVALARENCNIDKVRRNK